jgi:hypothetical protein
MPVPPADTSEVFTVILGKRRDPDTREFVDREIELYEPNEGQLATLARVGSWLQQAEDQADEATASQITFDAVNTYLGVLEALFVDRQEMVRAVQACASRDPQAFRDYIEVGEQIITRYRNLAAEEAPRTGPRPTKRAATGRARRR